MPIPASLCSGGYKSDTNFQFIFLYLFFSSVSSSASVLFQLQRPFPAVSPVDVFMDSNQISSQGVLCWAKQAEIIQPPLSQIDKDILHLGSAATLLLQPGGSTSGLDSYHPGPHISFAAMALQGMGVCLTHPFKDRDVCSVFTLSKTGTSRVFSRDSLKPCLFLEKLSSEIGNMWTS